MPLYGLVELRRSEHGALLSRVLYDQARLDVSLTGAASEGASDGP